MRDLVGMRWKWLQLQRFSALLWNDAGRTEYFSHAMRALDALANFAPQETSVPLMPKKVFTAVCDGWSVTEDADALSPVPVDDAIEQILEYNGEDDIVLELGEDHEIPPPDPSFYYALPEAFDEWSEPPPTLPPTVLQLLLAEGAAIWLCEAMPTIRRYIQHTPLTDLERMWFECAQESEAERNERWRGWRNGLEKVREWCTQEDSGIPGEASVVKSVARALQAMARAERGVEHETVCLPEPAPKLVGQVCLSCRA